MAPPVWVLSVDLQTRTATFQSGMADAAKAARSSFSEIKAGAGEMATETGYKMSEARHGVMLLGEEFGVHLPRALTSFIASIGPIGTAMEAAFPFLAIAVGATLLLEHLSKLREEGEKLTENQEKFHTAVDNAFNALDEKLLQAGIRADELNGDHLAALHKQLELIDRQSMSELVHEFETLAKAADVVFGELKSHWYTFGIGSSGAQHALTEFKTQYDLLLAQGKDSEAADLLAGTRRSAERVLEMQRQALANQTNTGIHGTTQQGDYGKFEAAMNELKAAGVGITEKEVQSQQTLVDVLQAQVEVQGKVNELKKLQSSNAVSGENHREQADSDAEERRNAEAAKKAQEKADRQWEENYRNALAKLQESEREKIEATEKGSAERLAAIDAAIKDGERYGLQEVAYWRGLGAQRVAVEREMSGESSKLQAEAGRIDADHTLKMGELQIAADRENQTLMDSARRITAARRIDEETEAENKSFALKMSVYERDIAALDAHGKDYENKLKNLQNKEAELTQEHQNKITAITNSAEEQRNARILSAETRFQDSIAQGLTSTLTRHQSFAKMIDSIGDQVVTGMMQNAIKSILANDFTKESDAAAAARKAYNAGMHFPFPVNLVMAPALGAMAFASVMAFEKGGLVPGVEKGDVVNAKLEPGETVIPKQMTERLNRATDEGGKARPITVNVHHSPNVQALDADGVDDVLSKHADTIAKHVSTQLRKMNL